MRVVSVSLRWRTRPDSKNSYNYSYFCGLVILLPHISPIFSRTSSPPTAPRPSTMNPSLGRALLTSMRTRPAHRRKKGGAHPRASPGMQRRRKQSASTLPPSTTPFVKSSGFPNSLGMAPQLLSNVVSTTPLSPSALNLKPPSN